MTISVTRLTPCFAARIDGVDISRPVAEPVWGEIRAALDEHSVLVFRGQPLNAVRAPVEPRHQDRRGHPVRGSADDLSARIIPPAGGATEFASARGAYPSLPEALKRRVERAIVVHDFSWSRDQVRPGFFTDRERAEYPPGAPPPRPRQSGERPPGAVPRGARLAWRGCRWRRGGRVLHRATPFDTTRYKRLMQRTMVSGGPA